MMVMKRRVVRARVTFFAIVLVACALAEPAFAQTDVRLSPAHWPKAHLDAYLEEGSAAQRHGPRFESDAGLIIGTSSPFSVHAGLVALEQGGGAVDAAIVTSLAQIVHAAGATNSFAGLLYLVYYDAGDGQVHTLNAGYNTLLQEDDPLSIPRNPTPSGRTALVPGYMAGIEAAHRRFGKLPLRELLAPAVYLAEHGFVLTPARAGAIAGRRPVLSLHPETRAVFTNEQGEWLKAGDGLSQPAVARTLRAVALEGAAYMYTGPWAERFVAAVREEGGKVTLEDLRRYRPTWAPPITARFGEYVVNTLPPPELGSVQLIEAINVLEASDVIDKGHYTKSADALYWLMQICRFGQVMTFTPRVYQPNPSRTPAEGQIGPLERIAPEAGPQNWERIQRRDWETKLYQALRARGTHSDAIIAVDKHGNMAVLLHSINAVNWGTSGIFVDGVSIPDSGAHNQEMIARVGPGERVPIITNPLIVTRAGKPFLGAASIGSSLHESMLQSLVDILAFDLDPKTSVRTPKFWGPVWRRQPYDDPSGHPQVVDEGTFPPELLDAVRERGQPIEVLNPKERWLRVSYWIGLQIEPESGQRRAAATIGWAEGQ